MNEKKYFSHEDIRELIYEALQLPKNHEIVEQRPPSDVQGWDSLGWMKIIAAIERAANTTMPLDTFDDVISVADFYKMVLAEINGQRDLIE